MKPINKTPRLIRIAAAVIVAGGLAVMVLSAQDDLDTLRQAAEQGNAAAQFSLGLMYADGEGVPKDDAEAVRWYRLAAEQGQAAAQYNLGVRYAFGQGALKDDDEAVKWFRLAAEQGRPDAQFNLGTMYTNGRSVPKDDAEANLGFYANGEGVPKDAEDGSGTLRRSAEQPRVHVRQRERPQGRCRSREMVPNGR